MAHEGLGTLSQLAGPAPVRRGEKEGAERLRAMVDDHWAFVGRLLRNLGVPEAELDDGVQQVYMVASSKLDQIEAGRERAFLASTAVHIAARVRRSRGRSREVASDDQDLAPDAVASADELLDRKRALAMLDVVLGAMPIELRSVFLLHEIEEMTMADIATALDIPAGTVASRLRRARETFRDRVRSLRGAR